MISGLTYAPNGPNPTLKTVALRQQGVRAAVRPPLMFVKSITRVFMLDLTSS